MQRLTLATNNRHKVDEISAVLGDDFEIMSLADIGCKEELPEEQETLEGNSLQKAEYVFKNYKVSCFADDTGLEVEALNGAPGVHSAHYAGAQRDSEANIDLLLKNLSGATNRKARFRTVITLVGEKGMRQFEGIVNGKILTERKGTGGFGYDSVFQPTRLNKTLAEMEMDEKNEISHRARAVQKLVGFLKKNKTYLNSK
jgi:XTP/dITP diphosphohydrolase